MTLIEFVKWCFESFWRWAGLVILLFWFTVAVRGTWHLIFEPSKKKELPPS